MFNIHLSLTTSRFFSLFYYILSHSVSVAVCFSLPLSPLFLSLWQPLAVRRITNPFVLLFPTRTLALSRSSSRKKLWYTILRPSVRFHSIDREREVHFPSLLSFLSLVFRSCCLFFNVLIYFCVFFLVYFRLCFRDLCGIVDMYVAVCERFHVRVYVSA